MLNTLVHPSQERKVTRSHAIAQSATISLYFACYDARSHLTDLADACCSVKITLHMCECDRILPGLMAGLVRFYGYPTPNTNNGLGIGKKRRTSQIQRAVCCFFDRIPNKSAFHYRLG